MGLNLCRIKESDDNLQGVRVMIDTLSFIFFSTLKNMEVTMFTNKKCILYLLYLLFFLLGTITFDSKVSLSSTNPIDINDLLNLKTCSPAVISPDGKWIAYIITQQRPASDKPGTSYQYLYLISTTSKKIKPYITEKVSLSLPQWSPDSKEIAFLMNRGEESKTQVWTIKVDGGEARKITNSPTDVKYFQWYPNLSIKKIAYTASTALSETEEKIKDLGFDFVYYEENLKHINLYTLEIKKDSTISEAEQLTRDITIWDFEISPDGKAIAFSGSEKNLIDYRYMFTKIYLLSLENKKIVQLTTNLGKLGNYKFSKDGKKMVYTAAKTREDSAVSQVSIVNIADKKEKNYTPDNFKGNIQWANWKDNDNIVFIASEGTWNNIYTLDIKKNKMEMLLEGKQNHIVFNSLSFTNDFTHFALIGSSFDHPSEVYYWQLSKPLERLTNSNSWLGEKAFGKQETIKWKARDGLEIEGILVYPINYSLSTKYPLIVFIHGGPESHYSNGWLTNYFEPTQILSGKGYVVFLPNYRASTGYGVSFSMQGYSDPAGKEFDDIADGIDFLVKQGIVDKERVGLAGGSYGGYAAAWFASYYTKYVKAVVMFVGISDLISKMGTTDIPYEELYVHSGRSLEEGWEFFLKRSPIYYANQSKTAVLIIGGTNDTRVHPSQSLEFYRRLKMNNHPAVRLVQYPGEGHGNAKQPARLDTLHRLIQWFDWYIMENKPLGGNLPPLDLTPYYLEINKKDN